MSTVWECKLYIDFYRRFTKTQYILQSVYNGFFYRYLSLDNELGVPINLQQWCELVIIITFETVVELE